MQPGAPVAVITDSTSYLPEGIAAALGIVVVPLRVRLGEVSGAEGIDISPAAVSEALRSGVDVSTSRPAPEAFRQAYQHALDDGARQVVSIHLSAALSGTYDAARSASAEFGSAVEVLDARTTAMGLGFAVLAAAEPAAAGAGPVEVAAAAQHCLLGVRVLFYVDSLRWLRRGGRIGSAAAHLGTALSVKPLLQIVNGDIGVLEKVRTSTKALARLADLACAAAGRNTEVDVAVQHLAAADRASALADQLRSRIPGIRRLYSCEVGAVIGAHVGPGLVGVVISPVPASASGSDQYLP